MNQNITYIFDSLSERFSHFNNDNNRNDNFDYDTDEYDINESYEYNFIDNEPNIFERYTFNNIVDNLTVHINPRSNRQYYNLDVSNVTMNFPYTGNQTNDIQGIYNTLNNRIIQRQDRIRPVRETIFLDDDILQQSFQETEQLERNRNHQNNNFYECMSACCELTYSQNNNNKNEICPILYEQFHDGDKVWKLPCEHILHNERFEEYIKRFDYCPLCLKRILD